MFAKLKKKIENEGGLVSDSAIKSTGQRDSLSSLPRAGSIQHLGISPPGSIAGDSVFMQDDSVSRDEIVCLLQKKSEQIKKLEGNISDLAALVKEKSKTAEKLEAALKIQEESGNKRLLEQKEEFEKYRDQLVESHQDEKRKLDKLVNTEEALKVCQAELRTKTIQCHAAEVQVERLTDEVRPLKLKVTTLESDIVKLKEESQERAELIISLSKERPVFEKRLDDMKKEMEEKQVHVSQLQTQLSRLDEEHNNFVSVSDLQRNKMSILLQGKEDHISSLQERLKTLEQRISDFSLSGDDQLIALQAERDGIDQKLTDTRLQLTEVRAALSDQISKLEDQASHLNNRIVEGNEKLAVSHRVNEQLKETIHKQVEDFRNRLEHTERKALESFEQATTKETNYRKQIEELENELSKQKLQTLNSNNHLRAKVASLDVQIKELETSRKIEQEQAMSKITNLEKQTSIFAGKEVQLQDQVTHLKESVNNLQELILEKNNQIDSLNQQIRDRDQIGSDQSSKIVELQKHIAEATLECDKLKGTKNQLEKHLKISEEENERLLESSAGLNKQIQTLKSSITESSLELERMMNLKSESEAALRHKLILLEQMVKQNEISETESGLHSEKVDEMNKTILSLQMQLAEKSRTMKKQEQTLKDLRVTLQRELKVQLLPNDEGLDTANSHSSSVSPAMFSKLGSHSQQSTRPQESQQQKQFIRQQNYQKVGDRSGTMMSAAVMSVQSSPSNMVTLTAASSSVPSGATDALTAHTDHIKRELSKDINFLYLKHVVLKFMLSREPEAMQLIKAVSMLLNFTLQEQQLIKDTLEWKMSWFGPRPSVGEGQTSKVIPPAL